MTEFEDPSYDEIRALLADAAVPAPMPPEVAARLDDVLADLVAERSGTEGTVVPLRRRSSFAGRLLTAAAAVVLVAAGGVGVSQVIRDSTQQDSVAGNATRDQAAEAPTVASPESALGGSATTDDASGAPGVRSQYSQDQLAMASAFTRVGFARQATEFVALANAPTPAAIGGSPPTSAPSDPAAGDPGTAGSEQDADLALKDLAARTSDARCPGPPAKAGVTVVPITFDGSPATLALHPVLDGSRYVAAWSCDGRRLLAYTSIPG